MKILQIFGAVVAVHLLAFIFIFASPGCHSGPRTVPTPDSTVPTDATPATTPVTFNSNATPQPVDLGTSPAYSSTNSSGHNVPTRPGSPNAAAVAPSHASEDVAPVTTYTIGKGDSLWSVAKKNHLSVSELAKANNLPTGAALKPGKKLMIPGKVPAPAAKETVTAATTAAAKPATAAPGASSAEVVKHTVASGESLGVIARKYQISVGELAAANNITDPSKVRAGQQLIIPGGKVAPKNPAAASSHASATKPTSTGSSPAGSTPAAATTTANSTPGAAAPHYEVTAPPPGQDLDAGIKENSTEVPTIKVEDASVEKK
jgi:LysM repeat protein